MTASSKLPRKNELTRETALNSIPLKNVQIREERRSGDSILIRYPVSLRPWIAKILRRSTGDASAIRFRKLQLDGLGSEVWDLLDGVRSVRRIIEIFAASHQLPRREVEIAVTQFLRQLGRRGIIGFQ
jgi:hypothetical protein